MSRRFDSTESASEILKDIKAGKYQNASTIYGLLMQIKNDLGHTSVGKEAKKLLDEMFN